MQQGSFEFPPTWAGACSMLDFEPVKPRALKTRQIEKFAVHVRDHKMRQLPRHQRSFETYFPDCVFSQARREPAEARRLALEVSYGEAPANIVVGGHQARRYELGPVPPADDIDPRSPAVVTWADGGMLYLLASDQLPASELERIAASIYPVE